MRSFRVVLLILVAIGLKGSYIVQPAPTSPIFPSTGTPKLIQAVEAHTTGTPTSLSVSFGTLPSPGNVAIVGVTTGQGGGANDQTLNVSDNQGNTYNRSVIAPISAGNVFRNSFWCTPITGATGTFTMTGTTISNAAYQIFAFEYSGTSCNLDKAVGVNGGTSPYSCSSGTTANAKDLLLTFLSNPAATGTITYTAPTGFTIEKQQTNTALGQVGAVADQIVSAVNTFTPTFGASQNLAVSPCAFVAFLSQ